MIARRLEQFCRRILGNQLEGLRVSATFDAADSALAESPVDVLLLDLNLSGRDGMGLLESKVARSFHTITVSANTDQALGAFEHGVIDFVAKPFSEQRLREALFRAADPEGRSLHAARFLAVRKPGRIELVPVDDLLYVQGADDFSELVLADGRRELHDKTLEKLQKVLPPDFERTHQLSCSIERGASVASARGQPLRSRIEERRAAASWMSPTKCCVPHPCFVCCSHRSLITAHSE